MKKILLIIIPVCLVGCKPKGNNIQIDGTADSSSVIIRQNIGAFSDTSHTFIVGDEWRALGESNEIWGSWSVIRYNKHNYAIHADSILISGDTIYLPNRSKYIVVKNKISH